MSSRHPRALLSNLPVYGLALAVASWAWHLVDVAPSAQAFDARGDVAFPYARKARDGNPRAFLEFAAVFPVEVARDNQFQNSFARAHNAISTTDVRAAVIITR